MYLNNHLLSWSVLIIISAIYSGSFLKTYFCFYGASSVPDCEMELFSILARLWFIILVFIGSMQDIEQVKSKCNNKKTWNKIVMSKLKYRHVIMS